MQLFYNPLLNINTKVITFDRDESRHISKVLRKNIGDILEITDGKGRIYSAKIIEDNIRSCKVEIISSTLQQKHPYRLHMAVAPTKMNDRYEWFLEKATEIGVDIITPIICDNSERRKVNGDRYMRVIQAASKQSLNAFHPVLNKPMDFSEFINSNCEGLLLIAHCEDSPKSDIKNLKNDLADVTILIGPEGDFSENEIKAAIKKNYQPITLGTSRLRTETAAVVACHSIAFLNR